MSRISALWTAGAVALLFALLVGAVIMRPVLDANADGPDSPNQTGVATVNQDGASPAIDNEEWWDDDDEYEDHDEHEDYDDDDEYGDDDEHEEDDD